jgi:peptide/nickel transport system ATP-binding protein
MDFNLTVMPGEAMGIVGESGCGKSTVALAVMQDMGVNGRIVGGSIKFKGRDMRTMSDEELRDLRGSEIAMIYQEPMASLNPAMLIGEQLMEVPIFHEGVGAKKKPTSARSIEVLTRCAPARPQADARLLPAPAFWRPAAAHGDRHGADGQAALLILDEPTTALDVTVEAAVVELVKDISAEIRHLDAVHLAQPRANAGDLRPACVMYSGEAVEFGTIVDVFDEMQHPYTQALFRSIPLPGADKNARPLVPIPATSRCRTNAPRAAISAPAATISSPAAATQRYPDVATWGDDRPRHPLPALRGNRLGRPDGEAVDRKGRRQGYGRRRLQVENLKKYYEVAANALFGPARPPRWSRPTRPSLRGPRGETLAIVGESGCGKSTLAKVLMGLETATGRPCHPRQFRDRGNLPIEEAKPPPLSARCRWCSRTRSTRSTRR